MLLKAVSVTNFKCDFFFFSIEVEPGQLLFQLKNKTIFLTHSVNLVQSNRGAHGKSYPVLDDS